MGEQQPDIEVKFYFNKTRRYPALDGYRPMHLVKKGYLTSGTHHYYSDVSLPPGGSADGTITFISPESYPHCLWIGKRIQIQEGERIVGYAVVKRIFNELLRRDLPLL